MRVSLARIGWYGHALIASAQRANRAAGEEVVGAQARHWIAGQQKHEPFTDSPEARRAAGSHGDPVNGQLAVLRDQRRREVFDADARATRDDDHIGLGLERLEDRIGFVRHQARKVDETAVALDEGGEHRSVGVGDSITVRPRTGWQQFVARHHQPDARPAEHRHVADANRTEHAEILRTQHPASLEQRGSADDVLSGSADILAGRYGGEGADGRIRPGLVFDPFGGQHGVAAERQGSAGHDSNALADPDRALKRTSRQRVADHDQWKAVIRRRPLGAFRHDGVTVHRGAVESGYVHVAHDGVANTRPAAIRRGTSSVRRGPTARQARRGRLRPYAGARSRASAHHPEGVCADRSCVRCISYARWNRSEVPIR